MLSTETELSRESIQTKIKSSTKGVAFNPLSFIITVYKQTRIMNFSETEQIAIDTYNDLKDQVKAFGLYNFEREDRLLFKQGRELLEQAKKQASQKKHPYTDMETECLLNAYLLNHADMEKARTVFFREFPNSNHSKASVWQKISRIRTLDNLFPQDTEWDTDLQVRTMCREYNYYHGEKRFAV